jgi:hypothetical protein
MVSSYIVYFSRIPYRRKIFSKIYKSNISSILGRSRSYSGFARKKATRRNAGLVEAYMDNILSLEE